MLTRRLKLCLAIGAVLGIFCITGAFVRSGYQSSISLLFSLWYNRVLMGILIGLTDRSESLPKATGRGALLGLFVSFAYYNSTGYADIVSFMAGVVYGMIIEYIAFKYELD